jgi:hypothetical protein
MRHAHLKTVLILKFDPTCELPHIHPINFTQQLSAPKQKRRASEMWGEDGKTRALLS